MHHLTLLIVQVTVTLFITFFYHGFFDLRSVYVHLLFLKIQVWFPSFFLSFLYFWLYSHLWRDDLIWMINISLTFWRFNKHCKWIDNSIWSWLIWAWLSSTRRCSSHGQKTAVILTTCCLCNIYGSSPLILGVGINITYL